MAKEETQKMFSPLICENIRHYVYCLIDPRDNKIFYIGKGANNRVFQHALDALSDPKESDKLELIREIKDSHHNGVEYRILRHGLKSEKEALEIESTLIDLGKSGLLGDAVKLTNDYRGFYARERGIKSISELECQYAITPFKLVDEDDSILFVNLHRSFSTAEDFDIYPAARSAWKIAEHNIKCINRVLAVYNGIVRAVYIHEEWNPTADGKRWEFTGKEVKDSPYLYNNVKGVVRFCGQGIGYYNLHNPAIKPNLNSKNNKSK